MPGQGPRAKRWCFTLNNYSAEDIERITALEENADVQYVIFGREVSSTGTPHLQGFVYFRSRKYMSQCIQIVGQSHFSVTRSVQASIDYCKKDGDFTEIGDPPKEKGSRTDLEAFKHDVKDGMLDMKTLREVHSKVVADYPSFVRSYVKDNRSVPEVRSHPLRVWQSELNEYLNRPPDSREIVFVVDTVGNQGKTWYARYYQSLHEHTQIILPTKKDAMAFVLSVDSRVIFFDCPRSKQGEFIQYDFLEEVKNGYVFSTKYESELKVLETPHVVVLMNEHPHMDKLSADRYKIIVLN